ncbi:hypothetical protein RB623_27625 [Mesorhizobium sp. LHD-90]|uniref:hypothetical protein n=1 Tax=Mesorhizobium sp. LHD-90 TaxID=3071414 RepID=UPI0027E04DAC|nr:hypothetical protein [Mesorhizobium sp. LHD-90]MDQ6437841.1 hypothetical protein [Mesorhizobium sp. LHD-90]
MKFVSFSAVSMILAAAAAVIPAAGASAAERDKKFFESVEGNWTGPGEIVAGKYKGTKFNCTFEGTTPGNKKTGMTLDGGCRVGVFNQKMRASIEHKAGRYQGTFLDGAEGKGLDIISGNVVESGQKVVLAINRKQLNGIMQAKLAGENTMNVTVSVRVDKQLVPVIGMSLKRVDTTAVGSID